MVAGVRPTNSAVTRLGRLGGHAGPRRERREPQLGGCCSGAVWRRVWTRWQSPGRLRRCPSESPPRALAPWWKGLALAPVAAMSANAGVIIPLRSGESIVVDELPDDATEMVELLNEEAPKLDVWLRVAVSTWHGDPAKEAPALAC